MSSVARSFRTSLETTFSTIGDVIIIVIIIAVIGFVVKLSGGLQNLTASLTGGGTGGETTTTQTGGGLGSSWAGPGGIGGGPTWSQWLNGGYVGYWLGQATPTPTDTGQPNANPASYPPSNMFNPATVQNYGAPQLFIAPQVPAVPTAVNNPGAYVYSPPITGPGISYQPTPITYVPYGTTPPTTPNIRYVT